MGENGPTHESKAFDLEDHTDNFNQDRPEFRESFAFKDKPE